MSLIRIVLHMCVCVCVSAAFTLHPVPTDGELDRGI